MNSILRIVILSKASRHLEFFFHNTLMYELIFQKYLFILKYSLYFLTFNRLDLDNLQGLCKKE